MAATGLHGSGLPGSGLHGSGLPGSGLPGSGLPDSRVGTPVQGGRPGSEPFVGVEVATVTADHLRASLRVTGTMRPNAVALLASVLRTHLASGRRYLRVDLSAARVNDPAVIEALVEARRMVADRAGILVFENAGPRIVDAIRHATLFVRVGA